jgi:hypothetical protein
MQDACAQGCEKGVTASKKPCLHGCLIVSLNLTVLNSMQHGCSVFDCSLWFCNH